MLRNRAGLIALVLLIVCSFAPSGAARPADSSGDDGTLKIGLRTFDTTNVAKFTADATKFLGRWQQTNQWSKVEKLATACRAHPERDLQALGAWYLTLIRGQELIGEQASADAPEARAELLGRLEEAVSLGYRNPQAIESADQLVIIRDTAEFKQLVTELEAQLEEEMKSQFRKWLGEAFARNRKAAEDAEADPWGLAETKSLEGEPLWSAGSPGIVILARIHHDGFSKLLPRVAEAVRQKAPGAPVAVIFYQYFADDLGRIQQTKAYVKDTVRALSLDWNCAVIGRERYETIMGDLERRGGEDVAGTVFLPVTAVLDKSGVPVLPYSGVLFDWQAADVVSLLAELPADAPPPPPPAAEEPQEEEKLAPLEEASDSPTAEKEVEEPVKDAEAEKPVPVEDEPPEEDAPKESDSEKPAEEEAREKPAPAEGEVREEAEKPVPVEDEPVEEDAAEETDEPAPDEDAPAPEEDAPAPEEDAPAGKNEAETPAPVEEESPAEDAPKESAEPSPVNGDDAPEERPDEEGSANEEESTEDDAGASEAAAA